MKSRTLAAAAIAGVVIGAVGYGAYRFGMSRGAGTPPPAATAAQAPGAAPASDGRKILYWHDPMVPGQKFDKPGKSPFMDMQLVPVYADEADEGGVAISPRVRQNLGIRTAEVTRGSFDRKVEVVGNVAYNEREVVLVQARANGFLERLHVRATLDPVRKGAPLAELLVPEWVAAQEEFLAVARMPQAGMDALRDGARQRMRLAGMDEAQIRRVETTGQVHARTTIVSPVTGVVTELAAREGMTVMAGAPLFRINGIGTVWVNAELPEAVAASVRPGTAIEARATAFPGQVYKGRVGAILPEVSATTRTIKARIELANPRGELAPGMFVTVDASPPARRDVLQVPTEAVIRTGKRDVVVVAHAEGDGRQRFEPVEVETGIEANGMTEIRKGLAAGTRVVVSGQFLIDSEASLKTTTARWSDAPAGGAQAHRGSGVVESVGKGEVTLSHAPIPSLGWDAMTMDFKLPPEGLPKGIAAGSHVEFEFFASDKGEYVLRSIAPAAAGHAAGSHK